jgi:chromosome segregation ATPase
MELKETLAALSQDLPEVPVQMRSVVEEAQALELATEALVTDVQTRQGEATTSLDGLQDALRGLRDAAGTDQKALETAIEELERDLDALKEVETSQQDLATEVESLGQAMGRLETQLTDGVSAAQTTEHEVETAVDELQQQLRSGREGLASAAQAVSQASDALQSGLATLASRVDQAFAALGAASQQAQSTAEAALARVVDSTLAEAERKVEAALTDYPGDLITGLEPIADEWRQRLEQEVRGRLDVALAKINGILAALTQQASQSAADCASTRQTLEQGFASVQEQIDPLSRAIGQVTSAARSAGIGS